MHRRQSEAIPSKKERETPIQWNFDKRDANEAQLKRMLIRNDVKRVRGGRQKHKYEYQCEYEYKYEYKYEYEYKYHYEYPCKSNTNKEIKANADG